MFRIAICEDEKPVLDYECSLVEAWAKKRACPLVLETYISAEQFLFESEDKAPYDLLIFDIQMKGQNGMELAKSLRRKGCDSQIIFVTGVKDYAIEGYEVGAVRYILKPVKEEVLQELLDKSYAACQKQEEAFFMLEQGNQKEKIPFSKIIYVEANGHYVLLKAQDFEREWKSAFSQVSQKLLETAAGQSFFCLRRGLLVNLKHVERITRTDCQLDNGESLPVARGVYKDLNEAFIKCFKVEPQGMSQSETQGVSC